MRKRDGRLLNIIRNRSAKRGEMLVETIVAVAIFAVVMVAVSSMVVLAYNMLSASREQYEQISRWSANAEAVQGSGEPNVLQYQFDGEHSPLAAGIRVYGEGPITFFRSGK